MANTAPINTQTELRRIPIASTPQLDQAIKDECDTMGAAGYHLVSTFELQGQLVLIFQLHRALPSKAPASRKARR